MRFGLEINDFEWPGGNARMGEHLAGIGRRAEAAGFDSIWVWDHFVQLRRWDHAILEGWLALAFLAAATTRVKLGTLVTGVTYRHPAVLVKQASTLDVLSVEGASESCFANRMMHSAASSESLFVRGGPSLH